MYDLTLLYVLVVFKFVPHECGVEVRPLFVPI